MKMKKLSPTEPCFNLVFSVEIPPSIPTSKIEKKLRQKLGFRTKLIAENIVQMKISVELSKAKEIIEQFKSAINEIANELPSNSIICSEYWFIVKNMECICRNGVKVNDRIFCIIEFNGKYARIYCNNVENYVSIKFFSKKPSLNVDPVQVPATVFTHCTEISRINTIVEIILSDINTILSVIEK